MRITGTRSGAQRRAAVAGARGAVEARRLGQHGDRRRAAARVAAHALDAGSPSPTGKRALRRRAQLDLRDHVETRARPSRAAAAAATRAIAARRTRPQARAPAPRAPALAARAACPPGVPCRGDPLSGPRPSCCRCAERGEPSSSRAASPRSTASPPRASRATRGSVSGADDLERERRVQQQRVAVRAAVARPRTPRAGRAALCAASPPASSAGAQRARPSRADRAPTLDTRPGRTS